MSKTPSFQWSPEMQLFLENPKAIQKIVGHFGTETKPVAGLPFQYEGSSINAMHFSTPNGVAFHVHLQLVDKAISRYRSGGKLGPTWFGSKGCKSLHAMKIIRFLVEQYVTTKA
jgi:hypothetical protein